MQKYSKKRISSYSITNQNNKDLVEVQSPTIHPPSKGRSTIQNSLNTRQTEGSQESLPISVHAHQWKQVNTKQQNLTYDLSVQTERASKIQHIIQKKQNLLNNSRNMDTSGSANSSQEFKTFGPNATKKEIIVKQKKEREKYVNVPNVADQGTTISPNMTPRGGDYPPKLVVNSDSNFTLCRRETIELKKAHIENLSPQEQKVQDGPKLKQIMSKNKYFRQKIDPLNLNEKIVIVDSQEQQKKNYFSPGPTFQLGASKKKFKNSNVSLDQYQLIPQMEALGQFPSFTSGVSPFRMSLNSPAFGTSSEIENPMKVYGKTIGDNVMTTPTSPQMQKMIKIDLTNSPLDKNKGENPNTTLSPQTGLILTEQATLRKNPIETYVEDDTKTFVPEFGSLQKISFEQIIEEEAPVKNEPTQLSNNQSLLITEQLSTPGYVEQKEMILQTKISQLQNQATPKMGHKKMNDLPISKKQMIEHLQYLEKHKKTHQHDQNTSPPTLSEFSSNMDGQYTPNSIQTNTAKGRRSVIRVQAQNQDQLMQIVQDNIEGGTVYPKLKLNEIVTEQTQSTQSVGAVDNMEKRPRYKPKSYISTVRDGQTFGGQVTSSQFSGMIPKDFSTLKSYAYVQCGDDFVPDTTSGITHVNPLSTFHQKQMSGLKFLSQTIKVGDRISPKEKTGFSPKRPIKQRSKLLNSNGQFNEEFQSNGGLQSNLEVFGIKKGQLKLDPSGIGKKSSNNQTSSLAQNDFAKVSFQFPNTKLTSQENLAEHTMTIKEIITNGQPEEIKDINSSQQYIDVVYQGSMYLESPSENNRKNLPLAHNMIYSDERELIREKYVKRLPQNLTNQVEVQKSFGGKKALEHLKNKKIMASQITGVTQAGSKNNKYISIHKGGLNQDIKIKNEPQVQIKGRANLQKRLEIQVEANNQSRNELKSAYDPHSIMTDPLSPNVKFSFTQLETQQASPVPSPSVLGTDFSPKYNPALANSKQMSLLIQPQQSSAFSKKKSQLVTTVYNEDPKQPVLSLFPPLKQRGISPRYNQSLRSTINKETNNHSLRTTKTLIHGGGQTLRTPIFRENKVQVQDQSQQQSIMSISNRPSTMVQGVFSPKELAIKRDSSQDGESLQNYTQVEMEIHENKIKEEDCSKEASKDMGVMVTNPDEVLEDPSVPEMLQLVTYQIQNGSDNAQKYRSQTTVQTSQDVILKEFIKEQISSKGGLQSILSSNANEQSKPQIITNNMSETIKYVRRIKNNDFSGRQQSQNYHDHIISPYSQDYDKKCILHQGPKGLNDYKKTIIAQQMLKTLEQQSMHEFVMKIQERQMAEIIEFQNILKTNQVGLWTHRQTKANILEENMRIRVNDETQQKKKHLNQDSGVKLDKNLIEQIQMKVLNPKEFDFGKGQANSRQKAMTGRSKVFKSQFESNHDSPFKTQRRNYQGKKYTTLLPNVYSARMSLGTEHSQSSVISPDAASVSDNYQGIYVTLNKVDPLEQIVSSSPAFLTSEEGGLNGSKIDIRKTSTIKTMTRHQMLLNNSNTEEKHIINMNN